MAYGSYQMDRYYCLKKRGEIIIRHHISVIVPTYKCHAYIDRLLASIAMQTMKEGNTYEVVLCNDCCPEGDYREVVKYWSRLMNVREIRLPENGGPGLARQYGIDHSESDLILMADSDDSYLGSNVFQHLIDVYEANNFPDLVIAKFIEESIDRKYLTHNFDTVWTFGKLYKRKYLDKTGIRFSELRANEDTEFLKKIELSGARIVCDDFPCYLWNYQSGTITRINQHKYTYASGHRGSIEAHRRAYLWGKEHGYSKEKLKDLVINFTASIYFSENEAELQDPDETEENRKVLSKFIEEVVENSGVTRAEIYNRVCELFKSGRCNLAPAFSIYNFLNEINIPDN